MASSRFFPSRVQSPYKFAKLVAFQILPNGSGTPTLGNRAGVASVSRTAAGKFTATLQDQWKNLVDAQCSVQLASAPAIVAPAYVWTDATDTDSLTFTATAAGAALVRGGGTLKVAVLTGVGEAVAVTAVAGTTTVDITINTGTSTPASVQTLVNTTSPTGLLTVTAKSGTTAFSAFLSASALTGGSSSSLVAQFGAIDVVTNKTVALVLLDSVTGTAVDLTAAAGNAINVELLVQEQ